MRPAFRLLIILAVLLPLPQNRTPNAADRLAAGGNQNKVQNNSGQDPSPKNTGVDIHGHDLHHENDDRPMANLVRIRHVHHLPDQILNGVNATSAELKSQLTPGTIVHFRASWCAPCVEEIPELNRFFHDRIGTSSQPGGIRLISVSNDQDAAPALRFMTRFNVSFPVYLDPDQETNAVLVGERALPATIIVDKAGRFHRLALGKLNWNHPGLMRILKHTAAKESVIPTGIQ